MRNQRDLTDASKVFKELLRFIEERLEKKHKPDKEMTQHLGAPVPLRYQRSPSRRDRRNRAYERDLVTGVGIIITI